MKYSSKTLQSYNDRAHAELKKAYDNLENIHVHVSYGNKKIGKTLNFNLLAIFTCGSMCRKCGCYKYCYAIKDAMRFPAVMKNRAENTVIAKFDTDRYFSEIAQIINDNPGYKYIRLHVSGEMMHTPYFEKVVQLAKLFPDRIIWTYTKQYHIINKYISNYGMYPSNLVVMFSDWDGYKMDNPYGLPTFRFFPKEKADSIPENAFICPGNCDYCKEHKCGCIYGQSAVVREH